MDRACGVLRSPTLARARSHRTPATRTCQIQLRVQRTRTVFAVSSLLRLHVRSLKIWLTVHVRETRALSSLGTLFGSATDGPVAQPKPRSSLNMVRTAPVEPHDHAEDADPHSLSDLYSLPSFAYLCTGA